MKGGRFILSLVSAGVFLGLVLWFSGIEVSRIPALIKDCRIDLILCAFLVYAGTYLGRAVRFRILLRSEAPPLARLYSLVAVHNLLNMILPVRTGELSYIYFLRTKFHVPSASGIATLVAARVLDLLCLMLLFGIGLLHYSTEIQFFTPDLTIACAACFVVALAVLLNLARIAGLALALFRGIARALGLNEKRIIAALLTKGEEVKSVFESIRSRNLLLSAFTVTVITWIGTFLTCFWILGSFETVDTSNITFGISIVGTTALNVTCVLPINGLGNLGSWEAGWAAGYMFLGLDKETAVLTGFGEHIIIFCFALLLGAIGWIVLGGKKSAPSQ